jgi:hypothetical protein
LYHPAKNFFTFTNLHTKLDVYPLLHLLVTHFSANHLPRTRTTSSPARERTTHLVCGSCKRKLEHVQTWVWLTQHTSDTLRLFLDLNCRTPYSNSLTSWNRLNLHKLIVSHVLKKKILPKFYANCIYITTSTTTMFSPYPKTARTLLRAFPSYSFTIQFRLKDDNFKGRVL